MSEGLGDGIKAEQKQSQNILDIITFAEEEKNIININFNITMRKKNGLQIHGFDGLLFSAR